MIISYTKKLFFKNLIFTLSLIFHLTCSSSIYADPKVITTIGKPRTFSHILNLTISPTEQVYVLDKNTQLTAHKLDASGKSIASFNLGTNEPTDIAISSNGYVYTTELAYANNAYHSIVKKWSTAGQLVLSWSIEQVANRLVITNDNRILVSLKDEIDIFSEQGLLLKKIKGYIRPNFPNQIKPFSYIRRLAINTNNELVILDADKQLISINLEGKLIKPIIANNENSIGLGTYNNLAYDDQGFIYDTQFSLGVDSLNTCHCIRQFDPQGKLVKKIGGVGSKRGQFYNPLAFRLDKKNNLYVADSGNNRVQKLNKEGKVLWSKGDQIGELSLAKGVVADSKNNIYVLDAGHYRIQKFAANGAVLKSWGSLGLKPGQFSHLQKITTDLQDRIYVEDRYYDSASDSHKERIQIFSSEGDFLAVSQQAWPSFDKKGNIYRIAHKLDPATNEFDYFLQKTDAYNQTQEWPLNYKNEYLYGGLYSLTTYPCTKSLSIDSQQNIYLLHCQSSATYNDPRHPNFSLNISLQKINPDTGVLLTEKGLLSGQGEISFSPPTINLTMHNRDVIYVQHDLLDDLYQINLLGTDKLTTLDNSLNIIGSYVDTVSANNIYSRNNQIFLAGSIVSVYQTASTLKAPIITSIKPLANLGAVKLTWQDRTNNETGFNIYRCKLVNNNCNNFQLIKTTKANVTGVRLGTPAGFIAGNKYRYKLTAIKGLEESLSYSTVVH